MPNDYQIIIEKKPNTICMQFIELVFDQRVNDLSLVEFHVDKEPRSNLDNVYLFFYVLF